MALSSESDETAAARFVVHFDVEGKLEMPSSKCAGNFRVRRGAVVEMVVLAGTQPHAVIGCVAENPLGELEKLPQNIDGLGHQTFAFHAKLPDSLLAAAAEAAALSPASVIIVEPLLHINNICLRQESISVQTVLSRCLGPFSRWPRMFRNTSKLGYNVVHFTPLQALGESGSCYSIADQLHISEYFLDETSEPGVAGVHEEEDDDDGDDEGSIRIAQQAATMLRRMTSSDIVGFEELRSIVKYLEQDLGLLSVTDLVLNHTANNSPWLFEHPESGYTLENSPWLRGAYELDCKIQDFNRRLVRGEFASKYGATRYIENEQQLKNVCRAFEEELLRPFDMHAWFLIDIEKTMQGWRDVVAHGALSATNAINDDEKKIVSVCFREALKQVGVKRGRSIVLGGEWLLRWFWKKQQEDQLRRVLQDVERQLQSKAAESHAFVMQAVEGHARWERLECKRGPLTENHWEALAPRYFTPLPHEKEDSSSVIALANNGWVMGWDATKDFAAAGALVYLRRELVVWSDCVKLRYGKGPEDAPFLWNHMTEYCKIAARVFHGVRLDNCHSTPIHVAQHMLRECRRLRPDFWVFAELFTGSQELDLFFERSLGINALIREAMQTHNAGDLAAHINRYSSSQHRRGLGQLSALYSLNRICTIKTVSLGNEQQRSTDDYESPASSASPSAQGLATNAHQYRDAGENAYTSLSSSDETTPTTVSGKTEEMPMKAREQLAAAAAAAATLRATRRNRNNSNNSAPCPALLYDCTHDNETPAQKMTAAAALPNSLLVAAAGCAVGSTRGYDELVPRTLSVVSETRVYEDYGCGGGDSYSGKRRSSSRSNSRLDRSNRESSSSSSVNRRKEGGGGEGWRDAHEGGDEEKKKKKKQQQKKGDGGRQERFEDGSETGKRVPPLSPSLSPTKTCVDAERRKGTEARGIGDDDDEVQDDEEGASPKMVLQWKHGGNNVAVRGDWDGWSKDVVCERRGNGVFVAVLRKGVHYALNSSRKGSATHVPSAATAAAAAAATTTPQQQPQQRQQQQQHSNEDQTPKKTKEEKKKVGEADEAVADEAVKKGTEKKTKAAKCSPELIHFKFIVDGTWVADSDLPCERDVHGNTNNVLSTDGQNPSVCAAWKKGEEYPGLLRVRDTLNKLHIFCGQEGFTEASAECKAADVVVVIRHHPLTHECIYFIARCAFYRFDSNADNDSGLPE
ncbi:uncharacterized protein LOC131479414, partial [Ochotona princeps]|uniref:uncharacterized protein LOC131479414 n=1 Tax=Ochotona princeps TaxID=9978 RepID=UPI0027151602